MKEKVIVSLSTIPPRFPHLGGTLKHLLDIMSELVRGEVGKQLTYSNLTNEGLYNAGRSGF